MKVSELVPLPSHCETFKRNRERFVPSRPGCYVLSTFPGDVLYVGLTRNLRRRMGEHLDTPGKTKESKLGRAVLFHWIETDELHKVERTWMNIHVQYEGWWPELNKRYSPTFT